MRWSKESQLDLLPTRTVEYSSNPPLCPQPKDPCHSTCPFKKIWRRRRPILSSTITPSPRQGDLQRETSKACLACCQLPVALLCIAPKELYCFNKIYSNVNWSRKIPITGSNRFPLDQLEYNPSIRHSKVTKQVHIYHKNPSFSYTQEHLATVLLWRVLWAPAWTNLHRELKREITGQAGFCVSHLSGWANNNWSWRGKHIVQ